MSGDAITGQHHRRAEFARVDVQRTPGDRGCAGAERLESAQSVDAAVLRAVDLELGLGSDIDGEGSEVAVTAVPWSQPDVVAHVCYIDRDQGAADAQVLLVHRRDVRHQERSGHDDRRGLRRVDPVRRIEVEVDLEQRGPAARNDEPVLILEARAQRVQPEQLPVDINDGGRHGRAADLDLHVGGRIVDRDRAADIDPGRHLCRREHLGQVDVLREVDPRAVRQRLDDRAIGPFQRDRSDVDRIGDEIALGVGQRDDQRGAGVVVTAGRRYRTAGTAAAADQQPGGQDR